MKELKVFLKGLGNEEKKGKLRYKVERGEREGEGWEIRKLGI